MVTKPKINVTSHVLVPKHSVLSEKEKTELLEKYDITVNELPKILKTDPAIEQQKVKVGEVIKVVRSSLSAGEAVYYRVVVNV